MYRQALQHGGSLGMQRMQLHELGASNFGMGGTPYQAQEAAQQAPQQQPAAQYQAHRPSLLHLNKRVPPAKDAKIFMRNFEGSEVYKGLGAASSNRDGGAGVWLAWPERYKVNKFDQHLRGKAEPFFQQPIMRWWAAQPTIWFVMKPMHLSLKRAL
ncbi:hypothetical protein PInf_027882 [Phytophthora infestans]|nr:hypothetical protein PInf_027882 [Phytophthora infestans]